MCVRLLDASWSSSHKAPRLGCGERCVRQAGLCSTDGGGGGGVGGVEGIGVEGKAFPR